MHFLFIPWFQLEAWDVPSLWAMGVAAAVAAVFYTFPQHRDAVKSWAPWIVGLGIAHFAGFPEIPVQPFGLLVGLGVFLGVRLAEYQAPKWGVSPVILSDFISHVLFIGFVACYFLNGLFYETETLIQILKDPTLLFKKWLGLSSFGGFLGATVAIFIWKWRRNMKVLHVSDLVAWAFPLGWIFGRLGCFVVHDHPGATTDFFLGVENWGGEQGVIRHDLGFYEVIFATLLMTAFWFMRNWKDRPTGIFAALLPLIYTPFRFGLDFLRATDVTNPDDRYFGLTPGHYSSVGFFVFSLVLLFWIKKNGVVPVPENMKYDPARDDAPAPAKKSAKA